METRTLIQIQKDLLKTFAFNHSDSFAIEITKVFNKIFI